MSKHYIVPAKSDWGGGRGSDNLIRRFLGNASRILVTLYTLLSLTGRKEHTISKKDRFNNDFRMAYHTPYTKTGNMDFFFYSGKQ